MLLPPVLPQGGFPAVPNRFEAGPVVIGPDRAPPPIRSETVRPVDGPAAGDRVQTWTARELPWAALFPPDPEAPTGPPPSFDSSPLEQLRLPLDGLAPVPDEEALRETIRSVLLPGTSDPAPAQPDGADDTTRKSPEAADWRGLNLLR